MGEIETYKVDNESEADDVLRNMKSKSMDDVDVFAQRYIKDENLKNYFLNKARAERS